jgi:uncharacterized membrane protein YGL010W
MTTATVQRRTADEWFAAYGVSHQHPVNKLLHWVCVPAIVLSILGLLASFGRPQWMLSLPYFNWATLVVLAAMVFYVRLSWPLSIGMFLCSSLALAGIHAFEAMSIFPLRTASIIVFVVAWIGQFIGHKIEGKKPSFFEDLQFLLIGPIWLLAFLYRKWGVRY